MKTATQNLEHDHEQILRLIDVMFVMSERKASSANDIEKVIYLIRNFADGLHHAKEENLLFPAMVTHGFSEEQGPIAVMLSDHVQGRKFVKGMVEGLEKFKIGNPDALTSVYENMIGYGQLLRNHISKENNVLFRMADKAIPPSELEQLRIEFEEIEKSSEYSKNIPEFIKAINELNVLYS